MQHASSNQQPRKILSAVNIVSAYVYGSIALAVGMVTLF